MRFAQKLAAALVLLASTGMWRSNYAPPLHRLLWKLGMRVPPPHFVGFAANFVSFGLWLGVVWGLLMWFTGWSRQSMAPQAALGAAIFVGLFFGLCMAGYYRYGARKHGIPPWRDFRPADDDSRT
jgi:hypothetical protein